MVTDLLISSLHFFLFLAESLPQDSAPTLLLYYTILFFLYPAFSFAHSSCLLPPEAPKAGDSAETGVFFKVE